MFHTDLSNDFEFSEYRLNESHALFGGAVDVLSVVSPCVVRRGCNSFYGRSMCAKCYFVEICLGEAELCYCRKWSYDCCLSGGTVWPFATEYAILISRCCTYALLAAYLDGYPNSPYHFILPLLLLRRFASLCFCRRWRSIKRGTWCRLRLPDRPTVSVCDVRRTATKPFVRFSWNSA
jgi:hypothetical protein